MKLSHLIIFLTVVLSVYSLINLYIFVRGLQAIPNNSIVRTSFKITFGILFISYILARILERTDFYQLGRMFNWIGSFWLAAMLYFFLFVLLIDIIRTANYFVHFSPDFITTNYQISKIYLFIVVTTVVFGLIFVGYINANMIRINKKEITINKNAGSLKRLNIMAISDIHLGSIIGKKKIGEIIDLADKIKPDIILFVGDLLDEDVKIVNHYSLNLELQKLKAPMGVYAVLGNHEYIGGIGSAIKFYNSSNITIIRDTNLCINNSFYLIGRDDRESRRFGAEYRKNLSKLMIGIDKNLPLIMLDHQPFDLDDAKNNNIDLQISGHTHRGQMFPFNLLTDRIFELSHGYKQKDSTHYIVSTGFGGWGPMVRIGSNPEVVNIILSFK